MTEFRDVKRMPTKADLDAFPIPVGSTLAVYCKFLRTVYFFRKVQNGYVIKHFVNKRGRPVFVRKDDYILTMDYDGTVFAGDAYHVFQKRP